MLIGDIHEQQGVQTGCGLDDARFLLNGTDGGGDGDGDGDVDAGGDGDRNGDVDADGVG